MPFRPPPSAFDHRTAEAWLSPGRSIRLILLLTTTGRKNGSPRLTPLQYEQVDGMYHIGPARGSKADWFRNILADRHVRVQIKTRKFAASAEPITSRGALPIYRVAPAPPPSHAGDDPQVGGLPSNPSRLELQDYARRLALATSSGFGACPPRIVTAWRQRARQSCESSRKRSSGGWGRAGTSMPARTDLLAKMAVWDNRVLPSPCGAISNCSQALPGTFISARSSSR